MSGVERLLNVFERGDFLLGGKDKGEVTGEFPHRGWAVGTLDLQNDRLVWSLKNAKIVTVENGFLEQFIKLSDAPAEDILKFARHYGCLGICEQDGLPFSSFSSFHCHPCKPLGWDQKRRTGWEPIAAWRYYARQAEAILKISRQLHSDKPGSIKDIEVLMHLRPGPGKESVSVWDANSEITYRLPEEFWKTNGKQAVIWQRGQIVTYVNFWLRCSGIEPVFAWNENGPDFVIGGRSLFAALAIQLVLAVSATDGWLICSACSRQYLPKRKPKPGQRHYCSGCQKQGKSIRDAVRDYSARRKEAQNYYYQRGLKVAEISKKMERPESLIRKWIQSQKSRKTVAPKGVNKPKGRKQ